MTDRGPDVRVLRGPASVVVEVTAAAGATLDPAWRKRWAEAARPARCDFFSVGAEHASARVAAERADVLLALADEVRLCR